jgi:hypothetical protein
MASIAGAARALLAIGLIGVSFASVSFALTSSYPQPAYLGPLCRTADVRPSGFDPWTGQPVGDVYRCEPVLPGDPPTHEVALPIPDDLVWRVAMPLPIGFVLGAGLATPFVVGRRKAGVVAMLAGIGTALMLGGRPLTICWTGIGPAPEPATSNCVAAKVAALAPLERLQYDQPLVGGAVLFLGAFAVVFVLLVVVGVILRRLDAEMSFGHARPMS